MAIYKIRELLDCLESMAKDGFEYINVNEAPDDDESAACLFIDAIVDKNESESEIIDAVELPKNYHCRGM